MKNNANKGTNKVLSEDPKQSQITSFFRKPIQNSRSDAVNNKDRQEGHMYQAIVQDLLEKAQKALNISFQQKKFAIELVRYMSIADISKELLIPDSTLRD